MKKNNENKKESIKKLQAENDEIKKKLTEEHGAFFGGMDDANGLNLPPEIESQFLNHIMAFENAYKNSKRILLYDFLKRPSYRKIEELSDAEITVELERIMSLMNESQVYLSTFCEVADRELYRFITEELFFEEKDDIQIPGMNSNFTYEEFHPNHEYDIRNHSTDFINTYLDKETDYYTNMLTSGAEKLDWHIHFREAFSSFERNVFSIANIEFDAKSATVQFDIDFIGIVEGSAESLAFKGEGEMTLLYEYDYWTVDMVKLPKSVQL